MTGRDDWAPLAETFHDVPLGAGQSYNQTVNVTLSPSAAGLFFAVVTDDERTTADEKVVAFVCDDQLFLKPTAEGREFLGQVQLAPPYPGAKDYFLLIDELEDPERLRGVLRVTADALPLPKPRSARRKIAARKK